MLAAVLLSLAIGVPIGVLAGRRERVPPRDHPWARRDADRARLRLPDADRDPVLGGPRRGRDLHDDLRDPAGGAHHRARDPRRHQGFRRGGARVRLDLGADPFQGAAPVGAPPAAAVGQPDDHVRALAGRDRRPDRRQGARRRGHQRPLLERGARDPRRHRDRDHGDRARPRHLGDRRAHRPHAPAPDRREAPAGAPDDAHHAGADRGDRAGGQGARRPVALPGRVRDLDHRLHGDDRRRPDALDPVGPGLHPGPDLVRLRHHGAHRELPAHQVPRAAAAGARRDPVVLRAGRLLRHRLRGERPAPGDHDLADADRDRRDGRLGRGDGHRLTGARGDRPRGVLRDPDRGLGRRERTRGAAAADRCWTRSRRCRSWSTSSRSST